MAILFRISRDNRDCFCTADGGPRFFVGRRVPYEDNLGLYNIFGGSPVTKLRYKATDYASELGFWSDYIEPTAACEGRNFLTLNTYDRAAFTFGFSQLAAHVPDGDFVHYFRAMLARPEASDYFPTLAVENGRIVRHDGPGPEPLESSRSTEALMRYLNPTLDEVEDREIIAAAKLIHWTTEHRDARLIQIGETLRAFKATLRRADARKLIDGRTADLCCVITDLLHHGRGGKLVWPLIADALAEADPFAALIEIGAPRWRERKETLKRAITANPRFTEMRWSSAQADFV